MHSLKRVLVAMSGGVDSSVAAIMLQKQGYEVAGLTLRVWDYLSAGCKEKEKGCCSLEAIHDAKSISEKLGIQHHIADVREDFEQSVIRNFSSEYLAGHTPNPCVVCNPLIKWKYLLSWASELNCQYIATGHYARIVFENSRYVLHTPKDSEKDQTYVLWGLSQEMLEKTLFPLGDFQKKDIRTMASENGLEKIAGKRESQEICFIPDNDYRSFLKKTNPGFIADIGPGDFILSDGQVIGQHEGYPFYTIGQRKGLKIAVGHPLHVIEIRPETNTIVLGEKEKLLRQSMFIKNYNGIRDAEILHDIRASVKIRYRSSGVAATIYPQKDRIRADFDVPVSAITPGQSAVFYDNDAIIGGGIIC